MEEKIKRVGDALWDDACHNRIADKQDWSKRLYELLDGEFPQEERVGDHVADVEDYLHNKYSFGFCDLCGDFINYDDDQWWDLGLTEGDENEWLEKSLPLWEKQYPDHEETIQDVCPICFHRLTTEEGFRSCPLVESDEKLPYYKQLVLTREFILRSEMLPVDPTCIDRTTDHEIDIYHNFWSEYYVIYNVDEYSGDFGMVEEFDKFEDASESFLSKLYELYASETLASPTGKTLKGRKSWEEEDLPTILDELFPSRKDDKGKE